MKKYILSLSLIIMSFLFYKSILPGGLMETSIFAKWMTKIVNLNQVYVKKGTDTKSGIKVFWKGEGLDLREVFSTKNGTQMKEIGYSYGDNTFFIIVDNYKYEFHYVKDNAWYSNVYTFEVNKTKEKQSVILKITGKCSSLSNCSLTPTKTTEGSL